MTTRIDVLNVKKDKLSQEFTDTIKSYNDLIAVSPSWVINYVIHNVMTPHITSLSEKILEVNSQIKELEQDSLK